MAGPNDDTLYGLTWLDLTDGLTFPKGQLPPVEAFWSLILYDATTFWLVANPINRYEVASHTDGLVYGADGSLTIGVQNGQPKLPLGQLAPRSDRRLPPDPPHQYREAGDPRRRLDAAAAQTDRLVLAGAAPEQIHHPETQGGRADRHVSAPVDRPHACLAGGATDMPLGRGNPLSSAI